MSDLAQSDSARIREYPTGATRNSTEGKHDYASFLSPIVIEAYGRYMHRHRLQADGTLRAGSSWKKGFGDDHYSVCLESLVRHALDLWLLHDGFHARETIDDAICGTLFNAMAYYHKLLIERGNQ